MEDHAWLRYGVIAVAVVGFLALVVYAAQSDDLTGRTWVVDQMTVDGSAVSPIEGSVVSAEFDNGNLGGIAGCNNYFTSYEIKGDSMTLGPAGSTLMFCDQPPGVMDQEQAYLALLGSVDRYSVDGDELTLRSGDDVLIVYREATATPHEG